MRTPSKQTAIACKCSRVNNYRQQPDVMTVKFNDNVGLCSKKLHVGKEKKCEIRSENKTELKPS